MRLMETASNQCNVTDALTATLGGGAGKGGTSRLSVELVERMIDSATLEDRSCFCGTALLEVCVLICVRVLILTSVFRKTVPQSVR